MAIRKRSVRMFHKISPMIKARMEYLEKIDSEDRNDGTPRMKRLRQITPEVGKFISLLFSNSPQGIAVEIGTSAGYSSLWLSLVCQEQGRKLYTFELLEEKIKLARETFRLSEVEEYIELVEGDALKNIETFTDISFCFLDVEKEMYGACYDLIIPKMVKGGIIVADNAINHIDTLRPFIDRVMVDERVDVLVVPIGKGELVCRKN